MTFNSQIHHRRSIRLRGYDYSQVGAYFVTVCVQDRECVFGEVAGDQMHLNEAGRMVLAEWDRLTDRFPTVELDAFVVMPNHVHGIVVISFAETRSDGRVGAGLVPAPGGITETAVVTEPGATTRVAPTPGRDFDNEPSVDGPVGAGLVPAPGGITETAVVTEPGATTRVAPTPGRDFDNEPSVDVPVGAGLVPAPGGATGAAVVTEPGATTRVAPTREGDLNDDPAPDTREPILGDIVGAFKSLTTDLYIRGVKQSGWPGFRRRLWQRNYYEHIIRSDESLNQTRQYILENPVRWATDPENPQADKKEKTA